jgi:hypothetical protein
MEKASGRCGKAWTVDYHYLLCALKNKMKISPKGPPDVVADTFLLPHVLELLTSFSGPTPQQRASEVAPLREREEGGLLRAVVMVDL